MAEEVKIVDVAGGPAAEATLQEILKLMKAKSGGGGGASSADTKVQELYTAAVTRGTKTSTNNTKAVKENTDSFISLSSVMTGSFGALGRVLMGATGLITNFGNSIASANTVGELVEAIPVFGSLLGKVTGYFDESLATFQQLSQVGGGFGNDIMAMRRSAAQSGMSQQQIAEVIGNKSANMTLLGGTVSEGASRFGRITRTLRQSEAGLTRLGMTQQDVNEGFNEYIEMMASSGQLRGRSDRELTEGAASYLTEIDKLAKVTGKSRKELQEEMNSRMQAANFNILASKLSGDALTNFTNNTQFTSDMMGSKFADALTDMADGVSQSEMAQVLEANVPGLKALAEANATGSISQEEYQSRLQALMPTITAFADSMGAAGVSAFDGAGGLQDMADITANARTFGERQLKAQQAAAEQQRKTDLMKPFTDFGQRIQEIRSKIEDALLESGVMDTLGTVLGSLSNVIMEVVEGFTKHFIGVATDDGFKQGVGSFKTKIEEMGQKAEKFVRYLKTDEFKVKVDNFIQGLKDMWASVQAFGNDISEFGFVGAITKMLGGDGTETIGDMVKRMIGDGLQSLWDNAGLATKIGAGLLALFTGAKIIGALKSGIGGMFGGLFGGGGGRDAPVRGPSGAGSAGKGVGNFVGNVGGGVLSGVAKGLAAFGNPQVAIGGAVLAGVILVIGAAVAGASWLVGKSLPTFAEGMKEFESLDGTALQAAGKGMLAVAGGMAAFGAGSAVAGIGNAVGAIGDAVAGLFGGEDPMEKIKRFQTYDFDEAKITGNANAVVAFSRAMAAQGAGSAASGLGGAVGAIGDAISGFFGGDTGIPYDDIIAFQQYTFDVEKVRANAAAMVAFNNALTSSAGANAASGAGNAIGAIGNAISSFFGGDTPFDQVRNFGAMEINAEGVATNAQAMVDMANALNAFSGGEAGEIEISASTVTSLQRLSELGSTAGIATLATDLNNIATVQGLSANITSLNSLDADGVTLYNTAMEKLVDTLEELNKVLAEDNSGTFGGGTGVSAASMLNDGTLGGGGSDTGSSEQLERLNMLVAQLVSLQGEGNRNTRQTVAAITNNLQAGIG